MSTTPLIVSDFDPGQCPINPYGFPRALHIRLQEHLKGDISLPLPVQGALSPTSCTYSCEISNNEYSSTDYSTRHSRSFQVILRVSTFGPYNLTEFCQPHTNTSNYTYPSYYNHSGSTGAKHDNTHSRWLLIDPCNS
jgi:hypothetical protein